jgi:hypothetical protein
MVGAGLAPVFTVRPGGPPEAEVGRKDLEIYRGR